MIKSEMDKWMVMTERVKREGEKSDSYCNCQQNVFGLVMNWLLWYQHSLKKTKYAHHKQSQIWMTCQGYVCVHWSCCKTLDWEKFILVCWQISLKMNSIYFCIAGKECRLLEHIYLCNVNSTVNMLPDLRNVHIIHKVHGKKKSRA